VLSRNIFFQHFITFCHSSHGWYIDFRLSGVQFSKNWLAYIPTLIPLLRIHQLSKVCCSYIHFMNSSSKSLFELSCIFVFFSYLVHLSIVHTIVKHVPARRFSSTKIQMSYCSLIYIAHIDRQNKKKPHLNMFQDVKQIK
jgi:hypothetical protein